MLTYADVMRIFVQRRGDDKGVRRVAGTQQQERDSRIPVFGQEGEVRGCRPVVEIVNQGQVVYSTLADFARQNRAPPFFDENEHDVMDFKFTAAGAQGVTLLGDTMVTCYHVQLKEYEPPEGSRSSISILPSVQHTPLYCDDTVDKKIIFRYCFHTGLVSAQLKP